MAAVGRSRRAIVMGAQWKGEEIAIASTGAHGLLGHHVRSRRRQTNPLPPKHCRSGCLYTLRHAACPWVAPS